MDEITSLLRHEGLYPQPVFLADSGLLIGQQVEIYPYQLIYRIDGNHLILCSFSRVPNSVPQPASLARLWGIFRRIFSSSPWLKDVRMLVITEVFDRRLAVQRRRLESLMYKLGAVAVIRDGDKWLEIPAVKLLYQRERRR
ncbi:MAG: secreted effector protein [Enterobacterales bacterium]|nr:secreted effector protein [Enterobacterales bacterium]MDN5986710.1 secreted effector protein [Hafniaceae bacterium]MDN5969790.1 secreted effector protein [Enterobacterales bacterium]MDN6018327.1 secreted effector protein [Enterobacterales bacterium]MDN6116398.1 secreted effector protein [Enterobacterales bacterium]